MVTSRIFQNRQSAGIELGKFLEVEYKDRNVIVAGIPRGGVEVAFHVAKILNADLCALVSLKLPFPKHPELAFGAVAEDGSLFLSELSKHLDQQIIDRVIAEQQNEIQRRVHVYREDKVLPLMFSRIVIVVDDGIATGATVVPALELCKKREASKIVVAAPIAGDNYVPEIATLADEIKIVEQVDNFFAVGQAYEDFPSLTDEYVNDLLVSFEKKSKTSW